MKYKKLIDIVGIILLFAGFFLAFLPHAAHVMVGLDGGTDHFEHMISGIIIVVFALIVLVYNSKKQ